MKALLIEFFRLLGRAYLWFESALDFGAKLAILTAPFWLVALIFGMTNAVELFVILGAAGAVISMMEGKKAI